MGIGYAKTTEIIFEINGTIQAEAQDGVFITNSVGELDGLEKNITTIAPKSSMTVCLNRMLL